MKNISHQKIQKKTFSQQAFTLTEVVIAVGVFALGVVPLVGMLAIGVRFQKEATDNAKAVNLARQVYEDLYQGGFEDSTDINEKHRVLNGFYEKINKGFPNFRHGRDSDGTSIPYTIAFYRDGSVVREDDLDPSSKAKDYSEDYITGIRGLDSSGQGTAAVLKIQYIAAIEGREISSKEKDESISEVTISIESPPFASRENRSRNVYYFRYYLPDVEEEVN